MTDVPPNNDTKALPNDQLVQHDQPHHSWKEDVAASRMAYEAWQSGDAKKIDHALDERARLSKEDPAAWAWTMRQIDKEEDLVKQIKIEEQQRAADAAAAQAAQAAQAAPPADAAAAPPAAADASATPGAVPVTEEVVVGNPHPGYYPDQLAPPTPNSPAYDAAYNHRGVFHGLDAGLFKIGYNTAGSLQFGVNIGLAKVDALVGKEMRGDAEVFPYGGPIHARAGAGIGIGDQGLHAEAGGGFNFLKLAHADGDGGFHMGKSIGVDGDAGAGVLFAHGQGAAGASLGQDGLQGYGGGQAGLGDALGARGGARVGLGGPETGVAAGVGLQAGQNTLDFGPEVGVRADGQPVAPVHLDPGITTQATFFPTGDRAVDGPAPNPNQ